MKRTIHLIAAARPNFMKIAPLYHALNKTDWAEPVIVHTGQHYDLNMSDAFFRDLMLPEPHHQLGVGSGSHAEQTGKVMISYEIWGARVAEDFFHGFSGWFIFMFGMAVLLLEMWVLNGFRGLGMFGGLGESKDGKDELATDPRGQPQTKQELAAQAESVSNLSGEAGPLGIQNHLNPPNPPNHQNPIPRPTGIAAFFAPPQFIVAVVLLGVTWAAAQGIESREKTPVAKPFAKFPLNVGDWGGKRDVIEQEFIDELKFSDYVVVDYRNPAGRS